MSASTGRCEHESCGCRGKIVDGRVQKIFKERALLEQAFIKDTSKTVAEHIKAQVATIGENIQVRAHAQKAEQMQPYVHC